MEKLLKEILEEIKPDKEYEREILERAGKIISLINKGLKGAKALLGGSGAKGTWLKTFDADIFVKFNYEKYKDKDDKLSDIIESFLKKHFKIIRLHGSRDYFQIRQGNFTFEIVPILEIKKAADARNITDVSPLHAEFVLKHKKLADQIRLTKQFFKAAGIYGAESYIRGFSGYVCEILAIYCGSFLNLLKAASKWKEKEAIDLKNYYRGKNVLMELNKSKLVSPLIVIDPVQKDRNAAAALDNEKFEILKRRAKEFLKSPSKEFFEVRHITQHDLIKKFGVKNMLMLNVSPLDRKEDVAGAKMLKAFHFIEQALVAHGFVIIESDMLWHGKGDSLFYYSLKSSKLGKAIEIKGPPLRMKRHVEFFKKKHKKAFVKGNKIFAVGNRPFPDAKLLSKHLFKSDNVKGNVKNIILV